jgi:hypothetical protein
MDRYRRIPHRLRRVPHPFFEHRFLDPFVVNDAFPAATETASGSHQYYGT